MDDVEKEEKQNLDSYVKMLEKTVDDLNSKLDQLQTEKTQLFDIYIENMYELLNMGDE